MITAYFYERILLHSTWFEIKSVCFAIQQQLLILILVHGERKKRQIKQKQMHFSRIRKKRTKWKC